MLIMKKNHNNQLFEPFERQPHKMDKHTQTIPANCLSEFDHFLRLVLKELSGFSLALFLMSKLFSASRSVIISNAAQSQ